MRTMKIGQSGIEASVIGMGAWAIGGDSQWGASDDSESIRTIHRARELGVTLLDTAPAYGLGHSEEVVGKALAGRRGDYVLSTKCGLRWDIKEGALHMERDGVRQPFQVQPVRDDSQAPGRWLLGIAPSPKAATHDALLRYGPVDAVGAAFEETWRMTTATVGMIWRMVRGAMSLENINGPISIAQYANASAQMGLAWFLSFLALLSLSLCIMNLLPIPILDGGHLLYYLIEMVKGSPVSERTMIAGQFVGLALLVGLMGLAFYNDILRLMSS